MTLDERKISSKEPIVWTGDLKDDCSAKWAGLLLRAEWMDEEYWWWSVYDIENNEEKIDDSNNYEESFIGGEVSRKKAEEVAREYINNLSIRNMKLSNSVSGALRTFAYFMASGTQITLKGINYLSLYGEEPSAIEQVFAIYANVIELDKNGQVLNAKYAEKRATDYLRSYFDSNFVVDPPYEDWETTLHIPPPSTDLK